MRKLLQSLFLLLFVAFNAMAQDRTITGIITGKDDGLPMPGVSVKVKGTNIGTSAASDGRFAIKVPSTAKELEFTSLGFVTATRVIGTSNTVNVVLISDAQGLNEVVVVAYGTSKKAAITGSVATLSSADLDKRVITNISNALAGVAPGISVNAGNGQPGTGSTVRIRGFGSFSASNSPLYVVDGAVFDGNIADINATDIESVSLLKDASSTALYGSRAANGIIIITTKKGKLGQDKLSINLSQGFSERGIPEYDRVNAQQYYPLMWQALRNSLVYPATGTGQTPEAAAAAASAQIQTQLVYNPFNVPNGEIVGTDGNLNPNASLKYNDFDWVKPLSRTGKRSDFNTSLSGNSGKSDYYFSLGYLKEQGYIEKSDYGRFNTRLNVNSQLKPWLKVGGNVAASLANGNLASDASTDNASSFSNIFNFSRTIGPIYPVRAYDAQGNPVLTTTGEQYWDYGAHPGAVARPIGANGGRNVVYETMLNDNLFRRNAVNARTYAEIKFLKNFTARTNASVDISDRLTSVYWNRIVGDGVSSKGYASKNTNFTQSYTFNQLLSYDKTFGLNTISVLAGHENYNLQIRRTGASKNNQILDGNTEFGNFVTPTSATSAKDTYSIESYLSKVSYNYDNKYFVDASLRSDGTSRFSEDKRWGTFYSVGASWLLSKEDFLKNVSWIDELRLKASYGVVGNDGLLNTDGTQNYYLYQALYDLGWNNGDQAGVLLSTIPAELLKWEQNKTFNTGVSFAFLKNRITGSLDLFRRASSNLLFRVPQPLSDPVTTFPKNIGTMYNKGIELTLGGDVIRSKDFSWNLMTNWTVIKNRITKMPEENPIIVSGTKRREVGKDLYNFYLRQWAGVDPSDGAGLYIPLATATTDLRTINGQTYTINPSNAKYDYSGSAIPDLMGSVNSTFNYKAFSFSFLLTYQIGGRFYDSQYASLMNTAYGSALSTDALDSWTPTNTTATIPRLDIARTSFFNAVSSRFLIDASYISFRNASLSYNLPKAWLSKVDVSGARLFVTGENLGIISKRKGMNPSESFDGTNSTSYVPSRMISVGLNVSL